MREGRGKWKKGGDEGGAEILERVVEGERDTEKV